ncbi:MAG: copper homeostasis protein CutC [Rhodanobacteraceae bacterium]
MSDPVLEVAANSVASALAAEAGGAARVELCSALELGGLTPSHATIAVACERLRTPVFVLIRPRAGDFVYDDLEREVMRRDIETCKGLGCAGVVIGGLDTDGDVDVPLCRALIHAAQGMSVTFHRAFDFTGDPFATLEAVIELGCDRLLTSGQADNALAGAPLIRRLIEMARGRITVMPGGGIDVHNIAAIRDATGAVEFHASAKKRVASRMRGARSRLGNMDDCDWQTDADGVRERIEALRTSRESAR